MTSPAGGVSYWFKQDEIHELMHVHAFPPWRGIAFLTWHRELCNRLEALLRVERWTLSCRCTTGTGKRTPTQINRMEVWISSQKNSWAQLLALRATHG